MIKTEMFKFLNGIQNFLARSIFHLNMGHIFLEHGSICGLLLIYIISPLGIEKSLYSTFSN